VNRVVARFADGRLIKGVTADFLPAKDSFHVTTAPAPTGTGTVEVRTKDLKALIFVRDYTGDPQYVERGEFDPSNPQLGRRVRITFKDGEVMLGTTAGYQSGRPGLFLVPADAGSNVERCYVVAASTEEIAFL
jgi:hypothetical protein